MHPPFLNEVIAKHIFLSKVHVSIHTVDMVSKKHQRSNTVQEEGLTNEGRHHLLLLHKQADERVCVCMYVYSLSFFKTLKVWVCVTPIEARSQGKNRTLVTCT